MFLLYYPFVSTFQNFFVPANLYEPRFNYMSAIDACMTGFSDTEGEAIDGYFSDTLREHLFADGGGDNAGLDLPALNIQRARDHGVPGET